MSRKSEFGQKKKLCVEKVQISFSEANASRKCKEPKRVSISGPQKCTKVVLKKWTHTHLALLIIPERKLRYCCINLIFYHSFLQNHTKIIAVLIFEKKRRSYIVNTKEKT